MTKEEELYYNNYFELFGSSGWSQLLEDLKDREEAYDISHITDVQTLYQVRGELAILRMLLNFEQYIEQGYEAQNTSN
jgi:hypothetical protein